MRFFNLAFAMQEKFCLMTEIEAAGGVNTSGSKRYYYSMNRLAEVLRYVPEWSSVEGILKIHI